ncbi:hypothetical protein [Methylotenera sp.]|uniref:hypothetical protein n=1 Tax=Methylotenera sp. TaxID=2051956 RepID=UPI00248952DB|nr:hypothetical protein [Methylotenera sp.]MDI1362537.1 hypothetical protein [Methylotenera sp.]
MKTLIENLATAWNNGVYDEPEMNSVILDLELLANSGKVLVSALALRSILVALVGAPHHIRELQVTMNPDLFPDNPISVLVREFNEQATS